MVVDFILSIMLHTTGRVQECAMTRFRQCPLQCMFVRPSWKPTFSLLMLLAPSYPWPYLQQFLPDIKVFVHKSYTQWHQLYTMGCHLISNDCISVHFDLVHNLGLIYSLSYHVKHLILCLGQEVGCISELCSARCDCYYPSQHVTALVNCPNYLS